MLYGRFGDTSGRPYMEGRLLLPRLRLRADVSFVVDTGADRSVLMPLDAQRIGVDFSRLSGEVESVGIGGLVRNYTEQAVLVFNEPSRRLVGYFINLEITSPGPDIEDVPSLLGRDVLDRWRMNYDPGNSRLTFTVRSMDFSVPVQ